MAIDFRRYVEPVPNFPKEGVLFQDLSPMFAHPGVFSLAIDQMLAFFDLKNIDGFAGIESRGFILASAMAARSMKGLTLIRKAGKLPPPVRSIRYDLEYGQSQLEMKSGSGRVVLVDDVLATGGTIGAALQLAKDSGYTVVDVGFVLNIKKLNQFSFPSDSGPGRTKSLITIE
jgi:adenine phosphoribosyltransferase